MRCVIAWNRFVDRKHFACLAKSTLVFRLRLVIGWFMGHTITTKELPYEKTYDIEDRNLALGAFCKSNSDA